MFLSVRSFLRIFILQHRGIHLSSTVAHRWEMREQLFLRLDKLDLKHLFECKNYRIAGWFLFQINTQYHCLLFDFILSFKRLIDPEWRSRLSVRIMSRKMISLEIGQSILYQKFYEFVGHCRGSLTTCWNLLNVDL